MTKSTKIKRQPEPEVAIRLLPSYWLGVLQHVFKYEVESLAEHQQKFIEQATKNWFNALDACDDAIYRAARQRLFVRMLHLVTPREDYDPLKCDWAGVVNDLNQQVLRRARLMSASTSVTRNLSEKYELAVMAEACDWMGGFTKTIESLIESMTPKGTVELYSISTAKRMVGAGEAEYANPNGVLE